MHALNDDIAARFARIALGHVTREYPNKPGNVLAGAEDARTPRSLCPVFFGSFDWHSCVHSYWLLARVLARFPRGDAASEIAPLLDRQLTPENVAGECATLSAPTARGFERPYGWAWLLKLAAELAALPEQRWARALAPLADIVVARFRAYLPIAAYPVRAGAHGNTAFALLLAADYADPGLVELLQSTAARWYGADAACPAWDEPGGDDFLSPALVEAACMRRLHPGTFVAWFDRFLPEIGSCRPATLFRPVVASDRSDGKIAHLDGLALSRSWCLGTLANALGPGDRRANLLLDAASEHLDASLPHLQDHYMDEHWRHLCPACVGRGGQQRKADSMTQTFRAIRVTKGDGDQTVVITDLSDADLMPGDVTVAVRHSTINYKDGLALTGKAPILRRSPMTPGVDFAGEVLRSDSAAFRPGDMVVLNGWGVGESHDGGLAERARVKSDWLIRLPDGLGSAEAMAIGTAGYTAALCVIALERLGIAPGAGDVLVTGAAGGVGGVAIALLVAAGHRVLASSRRVGEEGGYLRELGAHDVIDAAELSGAGRPLGKERWAAAIDSVGSHTLVNVLASTRYGGVVAACGLAQGGDLPGTVMPFILRGVTLAGIESVNAPRAKREAAWERLARDLDRGKLARMTRHVRLEDAQQVGADIVAGKVRGRTVVDL